MKTNKSEIRCPACNELINLTADFHAAEENRDRDTERKIVEGEANSVTLPKSEWIGKWPADDRETNPFSDLPHNGEVTVLDERKKAGNVRMAVADVYAEIGDNGKATGKYLRQNDKGYFEYVTITGCVPSFGDGLVREPKHPDSSYDRLCTTCKRNPIHRNNTGGVCADCVAKHRQPGIKSDATANQE